MRATSVLRVGSGLSTEPISERAARAACAEAAGLLDGAACDLAVLFLTPDHVHSALRVAEVVHEVLAPRALIGCTAQGVIGGAREIEQPPGISVWAAHLPGTEVRAFQVSFEQTVEGVAFSGFPDDAPDGATVLMLADPFTFPADELLERLNADRPGLPIVGGMASGGMGPGQNRLFAGPEVLNGGAVGVLIDGRVSVRSVVSQGCRPIGVPATVTRAERNIIFELGGRTPLERLRETFSAATSEDRILMQRGMHVGIVIDEYKTEFARGDFLIRGLMGADVEKGAVAVGDVVEVGSTLQFHVRDAASADEDLRQMLGSIDRAPAGVLLFSCNGRGTHMFPEPDHDARVVQQSLGGVPLAGFFAAGELGPVGGKNFLHGFTASLAVFSDPGGA